MSDKPSPPVCSEAFWVPSTGRESLGYCVEHPELAAWPCPWIDIRVQRDEALVALAAVEALADALTIAAWLERGANEHHSANLLEALQVDLRAALGGGS